MKIHFYLELAHDARQITSYVHQLVRLIDYERCNNLKQLSQQYEPWTWNNFDAQPRLQQLVQGLYNALITKE